MDPINPQKGLNSDYLNQFNKNPESLKPVNGVEFFGLLRTQYGDAIIGKFWDQAIHPTDTLSLGHRLLTLIQANDLIQVEDQTTIFKKIQKLSQIVIEASPSPTPSSASSTGLSEDAPEMRAKDFMAVLNKEKSGYAVKQFREKIFNSPEPFLQKIQTALEINSPISKEDQAKLRDLIDKQ